MIGLPLSLAASLGSLAGIVTASVGAFQGVIGAVQSVIGAIQGVTSALQPFVEALSPTTIRIFNQALRDLQATVGVAFEPVFQILGNAFRQIAGILLPVMEQLRPVIESLTNSFVAILIPVVKVLADLLSALMPVFEVLAMVIETVVAALRPAFAMLSIAANLIGYTLQLLMLALSPVLEGLKLLTAVFDSMGEIWETVSIIIKTLTQTIGQFIKSIMAAFSIGPLIDGLRSIVHKVIEAFILFIARLAMFFGQQEFVKNLINNLKPKQGAVAAPENVGIKGFEQIAKDLATASATAAGAGTENKAMSFEDIVKQLEKLQEGGTGWPAKLIKVLEEISEFIRHPIKSATTHIRERSTGENILRGAISPFALLSPF